MARLAARCASVLALGALTTLAGCAAPPAQPEAAPPPPLAGTCEAQAAQFAMGMPYGEALAEEVRRKSGARTVRVLRPGMAVTMEYDPGRINLGVDAAMRVTRVNCG
ncbi:I78 family peptidase inhibitor [Ramlibacter sp.]|uniref:I78 family peptidase inhibitor n=1 Tax=Ramlibacter sp. TaxID=1917967 RepID=UPI0035AF01FE